MNEITIFMETLEGEPAEVRLAKIAAQLVREGVTFRVREDAVAAQSGLPAWPAYVVELTGGH